MTAVLAAAPAVTFATQALLGTTPFVAAMVGLIAVVFFQAGLALLWARDLERSAAALERGFQGQPPAAEPWLPGLGPLVHGGESRLRRLAARAASAEAALRAEAAIIEALPNPLLVLGADHQLRRTNAAARRELGTATLQLLRHPTLRAALDRARTGEAAQTVELAIPVPVARDWQATVAILDPGLVSADCFVVVLTDRTRENAVERMRADFVANASHELRTPLASLAGLIETLRGPAADDLSAAQRFLGIMADQAARMERLVADLLSLSRIELNEHQRPTEPVDLAGLASGIAEEFEPRVRARDATLDLAIAPDLPPVPGDADQLAQVMQNLLDNALRHGRDSSHIRLSLERAGPGEGWPQRPGLAVAVADDGPGIGREHIPRLTERFYRVDRGRSRSTGGTGLGLAIVKHILNRHHGQLRIESEEGRGSTFSLWLPLD